MLPRLGVRARPLPWLTLLGNLGRAVRIPNLQELFGTEGVVLGNPDLQAEKAKLRDVGCRVTPPCLGAARRGWPSSSSTSTTRSTTSSCSCRTRSA